MMYIDEFNITTINIEVTTDGVKEVVPLTPLLIENYTSDLVVGKNTLIINYQGIKKELVINIIEREYYTEGLEFTLNESLNSYNVVGYKGSEKEVIVVEGKSDKQFLETFIKADFLICNGTIISLE